jgi:putative MATE family efflux protein
VSTRPPDRIQPSPPLDAGAVDPTEEPVALPARPRHTADGLTPDGRFRAGNLAGRTLRGAIWVLCWPILIESFLNSLVGLTDTVLAAAIDDGGAATDAVGAASYVLWFVGLIVGALGVGAQALISRSVGARRLAVANAGLGQTMLLAVTLGTIVGIIIAALAGPISQVMNLSPEAARPFRTFLLIDAFNIPFMAILACGIACSRGAGDALRPLWAMVIVNSVNSVVSWALSGVDLRATRFVDGLPVTSVFLENPFSFDLGVAGIALGTLIANAVGAAFIIFMLARGTSGIRLLLRRLAPHRHTIARLVRVGWPNFLETLGMWAGNFLIILMVGWMAGKDGGYLGSHIIAIRIEAFSFLPGFAISLAAATLAGQYLGAGSPALARRAVLTCTVLASAIMGLLGIVMIAWPEQIVGLFTSQPTHLELTPRLLYITGWVQIPFAISIVLRSALRGAGDVKAAMWLTWVTTYGVRLPLAFIISGADLHLPGGLTIHNPFPFHLGLPGLWIGLCIEIVIRAVLFAWRFAGSKWAHARV